MVLLRRATPQDADAIAHIHVQSWRTTYSGIVPDDYLARLNESERVLLWQDWLTRDIQVFVADLHGELVGFISGGPTREPLQCCDAELYAIYLLREAQGQGIGKALVQRLAESLKAEGYNGMTVWVLERNPAIDFYQKLGASRVTDREIEIGGVTLQEVAFAWSDLTTLASLAD